MNLWNSMSGMLELELTCAEPEQTWMAMAEQGVELFDTKPISYLTCRVRIRRKDYRKVASIVEKRGGSSIITRHLGWFWRGKALLHRPVLILGGAVLLAAAVYLPSRVLFVQVDGNHIVSQTEILDAAEACGISFGASRREVRSEKVKNALLDKLPQLQWAGINTAGCVATISVRERALSPEVDLEHIVSSLVAARDGYILSITATGGTPQVRAGQSVTEGQTLISGYTDCGNRIVAGRATGEIYAQTQRNFSAVTPDYRMEKSALQKNMYQIGLHIGKKYIKLWKDSGISHDTCGRMYSEYCVTLPGGFQLPVALCVDVYTDCDFTTQNTAPGKAASALRRFSQACVLDQMIAGEITQSQGDITQENGVYHYAGSYICTEMIGREKLEQIGDTDGERN